MNLNTTYKINSLYQLIKLFNNFLISWIEQLASFDTTQFTVELKFLCTEGIITINNKSTSSYINHILYLPSSHLNNNLSFIKNAIKKLIDNVNFAYIN